MFSYVNAIVSTTERYGTIVQISRLMAQTLCERELERD